MTPAELRSAFYDPAMLRRMRDALSGVNPVGAPAVSVVSPEAGWSEVSRLGVFSGSFNPLTLAHTVVAARAHCSFHLDRTAFALSTSTVDKEELTGLLLEDRLLTLDLYTQRRQGLGVFVLNRGLYLDQAEVLRSTLPGLTDLFFIVGFDKIVQIFDPRYYADRDAALNRLFNLATFVVAPRSGDGPDELATLLRRPENRRYADAVIPLEIPERYRDLSSTQVRETLERGAGRVAGLPLESRICIQATGAYVPPRGSGKAPYATREAIIEAMSGLSQPMSADRIESLVRALRRGPVAGVTATEPRP